MEKMLLLLAEEYVIPFILHPFNRQHRDKMSFSIWCPSHAANISPVTFALRAAVGSLLYFALLFLAVLPDRVTQHRLALQTAILLTVKWQTTLREAEKGATNPGHLYKPRVAYTLRAYCTHFKFIRLACWTFSEQWSSCLMEEAGCGVFYVDYFLAVGTGSETWLGDTEGTACRHRSELCTKLHASAAPLILLHGFSYICHAVYTHCAA